VEGQRKTLTTANVFFAQAGSTRRLYGCSKGLRIRWRSATAVTSTHTLTACRGTPSGSATCYAPPASGPSTRRMVCIGPSPHHSLHLWRACMLTSVDLICMAAGGGQAQRLDWQAEVVELVRVAVQTNAHEGIQQLARVRMNYPDAALLMERELTSVGSGLAVWPPPLSSLAQRRPDSHQRHADCMCRRRSCGVSGTSTSGSARRRSVSWA
jgi:hypothetical protein